MLVDDLEITNHVAIAERQQVLERRVHIGVGVVLDRFGDKTNRTIP